MIILASKQSKLIVIANIYMLFCLLTIFDSGLFSYRSMFKILIHISCYRRFESNSKTMTNNQSYSLFSLYEYINNYCNKDSICQPRLLTIVSIHFPIPQFLTFILLFDLLFHFSFTRVIKLINYRKSILFLYFTFYKISKPSNYI